MKKKKSDPQEPQSELLTSELKKQSHQSVSKALGEKLLYDTIGARHSSMVSGTQYIAQVPRTLCIGR